MLRKERSPKVRSKSKKVSIIIAGLLALIVLFDLTPFGGTMKFYSTWASCARKPVATSGSGYFNAEVPSYHTPPSVNPFPGDQEYFCTAYTAEKHGYSANPNGYDFPILKKQNALCQKPTDPRVETTAVFEPCDG